MTSWGRTLTAMQRRVALLDRSAPLPAAAPPAVLPDDALPNGSPPAASVRTGAPSLLPYGNGRSYGDSCLNDGGMALV